MCACRVVSRCVLYSEDAAALFIHFNRLRLFFFVRFFVVAMRSAPLWLSIKENEGQNSLITDFTQKYLNA